MPLLVSLLNWHFRGLCALAIRLERLINDYACATLVAYAEENFHLVDIEGYCSSRGEDDTFICIETHEGPLGPD